MAFFQTLGRSQETLNPCLSFRACLVVLAGSGTFDFQGARQHWSQILTKVREAGAGPSFSREIHLAPDQPHPQEQPQQFLQDTYMVLLVLFYKVGTYLVIDI
jgi:hypothetical protein